VKNLLKRRSLIFFVSVSTLGGIVFAIVVSSIIARIFNISLDKLPGTFLMIFCGSIGGFAAIVVNRLLLKPISVLSKKMSEVSSGNFEVRLDEKSAKITEIEEIYTSFNLMAAELGATETIQSDFVSNVSHEIKTPLSAIEGYATLLQDSGCTEEEKEQYIEKILFNTRRLSELVGNILLLSKIENRSIEPMPTSFRLDEQIRQSIMLYESGWTEKNIELDVDMDEITYSCDKGLLVHVWNNLISNAIKFSPVGGTIRIRLEENNNIIRFIIDDEGHGISPNAQKHIFDKFYQEDSSHKQDGNGLGLALVSRILDTMRGEVTTENLTPRGCRFTVTLPIHRQ
jgi:signal transduction histidine kinase